MTMIKNRNKFTIYDDNGKILIISRKKEVALNYAKVHTNVTSN
jgi:hypothetical protein